MKVRTSSLILSVAGGGFLGLVINGAIPRSLETLHPKIAEVNKNNNYSLDDDEAVNLVLSFDENKDGFISQEEINKAREELFKNIWFFSSNNHMNARDKFNNVANLLHIYQEQVKNKK